MRNFKKNGQQIKHNEAYWIKNLYQENPSMEWNPVSEKEVTMAKKKKC